MLPSTGWRWAAARHIILCDANYRSAPHALDSGAALERFERIVKAQGALELPPEAHAASEAQLGFARAYVESHPHIVHYGF